MAADTPYSKSSFTQLGLLIDEILAAQSRKPAGKLTRIWDVWHSAVGDLVAENAKPFAVKGAVLLVHVGNSTMLQQLRFYKKDLIAKINLALNEDFVKDINFKIGAL